MDKFEKFMKKNKMGDVLKKAEGLDSKEKKMVYIARYWMPDGEHGGVIAEFNTKKEYDDWYESSGKGIELEDGGKIVREFGPSEIESLEAELGLAGLDEGGKGPIDKDRFNKIIKKLRFEKKVGQEGFVFKILYKEKDRRAYKIFSEAETIEEARDIVSTFNESAKEEGYDVDIIYGPPEKKKIKKS